MIDGVWTKMSGARQNHARNLRGAAIRRAAIARKETGTAQDAPCDLCLAVPGKPCTSPAGRSCRPHAVRLAAASRTR
jgi:hypothetical protein